MNGPESPPRSASVASGSHSDNASDFPSGSLADADVEAEAILSSESSASSSSTAGSEEELEETLEFPAHQLQKLNEGLNRSNWVVHITCLTDCERAAAALIRHPER